MLEQRINGNTPLSLLVPGPDVHWVLERVFRCRSTADWRIDLCYEDAWCYIDVTKSEGPQHVETKED